MPDNQSLTKRPRAGRADALQQLDHWIEGILAQSALSWLQPSDVIAQQVHRQLAERFGRRRVEWPHNLHLYAYLVAQQTCIDRLRRQYRLPDAECLRQELDPNARLDQRRLFFQIFHALPDHCRRLWRALFLERGSHLELPGQSQTDEKRLWRQFQPCKHQAIELLRHLTAPPSDESGSGLSDDPTAIRIGEIHHQEPVPPSAGTGIGCRGVSEWLPAYLFDLLAAEARGRIAGHLAGCRRCLLELADLNVFAGAIKRYGPVLLEDHPTSEALARYAYDQTLVDPEERYRLTRHLALCHTCRLEHRLLLRVNESSKIPQQWEQPREAPVPMPTTEGIPWHHWSVSSPPPAPRWRIWTIAGMAMISVLVLFMFLKPSLFPGQPDREASSPITVQAQYPKGEVSAAPESLRWIPVSGAKSYRVGLYNAQKRVIWRSRRAFTTSVTLPRRVVSQLNPGQIYFWQVAIQLRTGRITRSPFFEFTIRRLHQPPSR